MSCRFCEYGEPKSRTRPGHHEIDYMGSISYPECLKRKESEVKLFANAKTKVVHQNKKGDACRFSEIKPENRVTIKGPEAMSVAINEGYRLCKICFRDDLLADDLRF